MLRFTEMMNGAGLTVDVNSSIKYKTPFQEILLLETEAFGKMLVLDGAVQTTEKDEFIYHEMIVHVPLFTLGRDVEKVLVIGGGDGGTVREALKHNPSKVDMVEIDREVVELCKKEFPEIASGLDDERVSIFFEDGREFIKGKKGEYDAVIIDCSDPVGPSAVLFSEEFYKDVKNALKSDGVVVTQSESPFAQFDAFKVVISNLKKVFSVVRPYLAFIPTYPSGMWSFTFASDSKDPLSVSPQELAERLSSFEKNKGRLKYYNLEIHYGAFAIPNFVIDKLNK
ncbi:polyamine aminopropyltransferase [Desulfurobacterium atlanticum]|uniref:Polyamine aminopropyltransferase n=1 Tax=Desulfurobacterium atlanticum TaxID=240169 RepID=A0A238ZN07_9BACT|nr:polyamine aminopropyltransferase [Desulfurobacterium atlanticum]SNR84710.1 spermidine synthase [Desulfurobacterium atlanticum]